MTPELSLGSTLGRVLCAAVLLILALCAGYAVVQGLANFRAITV